MTEPKNYEEHIRKRLDAATPDTWHVVEVPGVSCELREVVAVPYNMWSGAKPRVRLVCHAAPADADFIAHAKEDVTSLLERLAEQAEILQTYSCPECEGAALRSYDPPRPCTECGGAGHIRGAVARAALALLSVVLPRCTVPIGPETCGEIATHHRMVEVVDARFDMGSKGTIYRCGAHAGAAFDPVPYLRALETWRAAAGAGDV